MIVLEFERRCWAEVDLGALRHNFELVRRAADGAAVIAVVKADAYGHGDAAVAVFWRGKAPTDLPCPALKKPCVCAARAWNPPS